MVEEASGQTGEQGGPLQVEQATHPGGGVCSVLQCRVRAILNEERN